jgi:hypothetical protein
LPSEGSGRAALNVCAVQELFANFGLAASTAEARSCATPDINITYGNQGSLIVSRSVV